MVALAEICMDSKAAGKRYLGKHMPPDRLPKEVVGVGCTLALRVTP